MQLTIFDVKNVKGYLDSEIVPFLAYLFLHYQAFFLVYIIRQKTLIQGPCEVNYLKQLRP